MRFLSFSLFVMAAIFFTVETSLAISTPNISANALFLYRSSNFHKEDTNPAKLDSQPNGINIQEAELQFYADVDPYTKLSVLMALSPSYSTDGTTVSEKWGFEPEEAFAESIAIPAVNLKVGKYKAAMGKQNQLHTHAFPLVEAPIMNTKLLGGEGLNDVGVSAAVLTPAPWFSEFSFQYLRGKGENDEFKSPSPTDGVGLIHWKNLFDLSDALTLEAGASFAEGGNSFRKKTALTGADLTFKWRPSEGGLYRSFTWSTEYLARRQGQPGVRDENGSGVSSWLQYQFAERWSGVYRYDTLTMKDTFDAVNLPDGTWKRHGAALVFATSAFSSFKLEVNQRKGGPVNADGSDTENTIFLQGNFTIGAHPAHTY